MSRNRERGVIFRLWLMLDLLDLGFDCFDPAAEEGGDASVGGAFLLAKPTDGQRSFAVAVPHGAVELRIGP